VADGGQVPASTATIDLCDAVLGQIGRRNHLFGWLPVNAYSLVAMVVGI